MKTEPERIILRPWADTDAEDLYRLASNDNVASAAGWPVHTSPAMSAEVIRTYFSEPETYAIILKSTGRVAGCIGIVPRAAEHRNGIAHDERETGYWIGEDFWGQGLIPEALGVLIAHCRHDLNLSGLWIITYAGNTRSQRVAEKCGFTYIDNFSDPDGKPSKAYRLEL